jgi:metal-responsive CopG/Arc/MetJ family transcriptional regulator
MAKIAISLPDNILAEIEALRCKTGETRSQFLRRAAQLEMEREREREWDDEYEAAYRKHPETAEEVAIAEASIQDVFAANPWDEKPVNAKG